MYQVPSAQVEPPIQIVAQMIKLPTGAECVIGWPGSPSQFFSLNTFFWQSHPEKGKKTVSTCKFLEDLPIENWTLEALEVSIGFHLELYHRLPQMLMPSCHHVRHQNSWGIRSLIWDISKFHSRWTHEKNTFISPCLMLIYGNIMSYPPFWLLKNHHFSPLFTWQKSSAKDKPEFRFGISDMDDLSIRRTPALSVLF